MAELYTESLFSDSTLKAYYRFESGALTTDDSGEGHTLTDISDPAAVTGRFGGGVDFDGNDAYSMTDHADFKPSGNFSIGAWIKTSTASTMMIFQSFAYPSSKYSGILFFTNATGTISIDSGKNTGAVEGTDKKRITSTRKVNDGVWHFVVGTWDGSALKLYIDGELETSANWANAPVYDATNYVRVGCQNNTGTNISFFTGSMDDVMFFNGKALSLTEVSTLFHFNYGAAVSQRGYDVKTCADRYLIYSSAFQTLKIHSITKVTGTLPITITHNIGHFVPYEVIAHDAPQYAYQAWKRIPFSDGFFYNSCTAKGYINSIVLENGEYDPEVSNSYTVIIYLDNFSTVAEKSVNTGTTSGSYSEDYGIRCSKDGYDVKTCTDLECSFTSKQGFSEIIHKKGIDTQRTGQITVSHNQGTPLKFLAFQKLNTNSYMTPCIRRGRTTLTFDGAYIDSSNLTMGVDDGGGAFATGYDFYYVMFKNRLA